MTMFGNVLTKIRQWNASSNPSLALYGLDSNQWGTLFHLFAKAGEKIFQERDHLFICPTLDEAENLHEQLSFQDSFETFHFPGLEIPLYSGALTPESNLIERFGILDRLLRRPQGRPLIIVCSLEAFLLKLPPVDFFKEHSFQLAKSDIISPINLAEKLVALGYSQSPTVEEAGTFSKRGEIFDIFPMSHRPVRIHYYDDMVEEIFAIDLANQKTLKSESFQSVHIAPGPRHLASPEFSKTFKAKVPLPGAAFKNKFQARKEVFDRLSEGQLFENYPAFLPLFFNSSSCLLDYLDRSRTQLSLIEQGKLMENASAFAEELREKHAEEVSDQQADSILPPPGEIYHEGTLLESMLKEVRSFSISGLKIHDQIEAQAASSDEIQFHLENMEAYFIRNINKASNKADQLKNILTFIKREFQYDGRILISCLHENSQQEIAYLLETHQVTGKILERISYDPFPVERGFFVQDEKILIMGEGDFFSNKKAKTAKLSSRKVDLFAEQLASLKDGDFVIHNMFGVGEYRGLETLTFGGQTSDFLVLHYEDKDKIYVPVYKMNLIQKYADAGAPVKVNSLKSNKFEQLKNKAKKSAKVLAFDLLKLQAERKANLSFAFGPPDHIFREFELAFPFEETPDQLKAVEETLEDMQVPTPMDRLICGDVGFGKTEVAMRAAFKAILDKKQVAVLVPTTILALQHYNSFTARFKDFPVRIDFLSRFKGPAECKKIIAELKDGKIDIVIGTHKLLSKEIAFLDLGLVIVDEEQRFGVSHKEKFKLLKSSVDFLTLSATPIPRTMQLSFLGLRDLSLIQTPPPRRQSIKTYIIKFVPQTVKEAIEKEINRGGQVFFVHNRVMDIEEMASKIRTLVSKAKVLVAHGQLSEKEIEKRMSAFYVGSYNVLVTTTIIESGLDIPNANTLIVHRAETFGLSQLHQLRGRIGRSDKKAYAYFIVNKDKNLSDVADQRLKALQTYTEIGSGFAIASADLEIRGAGDILGAEQSGHIATVGLELYTELLNEAILELRGENVVPRTDIEVQTSEPAFIPHHYIADPGERLKYYKKLSNCIQLPALAELQSEMLDIFGPAPAPLRNLLLVLEVRINLQNCGLKSIRIQADKIHLKFDKNILDANGALREKILDTFLKRPKVYKLSPDYSIIYTHSAPVTQNDLLNFSKNIAGQIIPC